MTIATVPALGVEVHEHPAGRVLHVRFHGRTRLNRTRASARYSASSSTKWPLR